MKDNGSEGSSSYYGPGVICCSVNTFACTNFTWGFFSLVFFVLGLVGLLTNEGFLLLFVEEIYITLTVFGGLSFFVVLLGMLGACARVEIFFICHIFLMGLIFFAQSLAIIFFILYLNDVGTLGEVDDAANGAQEQFEDQLIDFAIAEPQKWIETQDQFDCCGISLAAGEAFQTGAECANAEFQFCLDRFAELVFELAPFVGTAAGFLLLFQLGAIVAAIRMYWVPVWRGGWMFDEEELEQMAEEKNLKYTKKPEIQGSGTFNALKNAGNRLSFRVQNAFTPNPNVPQGAGFLKRLSYNANSPGFGMPQPNNRGAGFGAPGPKPQGGFSLTNGPPPPGGGGGRTFGGPPAPRFNRLSNRLSAGFQAFGNAFGQIRNSFKPPPPPAPSKPTPPPGYAGVPPPGIGGGNNYGQKTYTPQRAQQAPPTRGTGNSFPGQTNGAFNPPRGTDPSFGPPPPRLTNGPTRGTQPTMAPPRFTNNGPTRGTQPSMAPPRFTNNGPTRGTQPSMAPPPAMGGGPPPANNWTSAPNVYSSSWTPPKGAPPPVSSSKYKATGTNPGMNKPSNGGGLNKFYKKKKKKKNGNRPTFGGGGKAPKAKSPIAAQNGGLLAQIQQGTGLKPTITNDRSAPQI